VFHNTFVESLDNAPLAALQPTASARPTCFLTFALQCPSRPAGPVFLPIAADTMALLVILLPAPAPAAADATTAPEPSALAWLLSPDGLTLSSHGESAPSLCPRADSVVVVVPAVAIAWHRPTTPRAPANRMRAALGGMLEEQLLADDDQVHLALAPRALPGLPTWVAAMHKPWLQAQLARLAGAGLVVDRLVPALAPSLLPDGATAGSADAADMAPTGHFFNHTDPTGVEATWLALSDADSALCLPLVGGLARTSQLRWSARSALYSATPAAAAAAEQWLDAPVAVRSAAEQALAAVRSPWNLLQFDLAPQHRSSLALGKLGRQLRSPAWAPVRYGVLTALLLQLVGLNLVGWQQERAVADKRAAMDALLRSSHPQVRAVLDAPLQMQRETAALRVAAGVPGEDDFEPMAAAAAAAWPDGQPPATQLRFEPGRLSLPAVGWQAPQIAQLRSRLQPAGWALVNSDGRLVIQRAAPSSSASANR
jgi:general secretion pathway protein L